MKNRRIIKSKMDFKQSIIRVRILFIILCHTFLCMYFNIYVYIFFIYVLNKIIIIYYNYFR